MGTGEAEVILMREFFTLCTAIWKSLCERDFLMFLALQSFKTPCILGRRMWVQEERKEEWLSPGRAVSCFEASLSTSKFLSSCVGSARKNSFVAEAQQDTVHVR